jgi:uncharacterized paraquat-inducible protein A
MPLIECPTCHYKMPVRAETLHQFNQCLRCTSRFIPAPDPPRKMGRAVIAACGVLVASMAAAAWIVLRPS